MTEEYGEEYIRLRKNSYTDDTDQDDDSEQLEAIEENDRLDFLHSIHLLKQHIDDYRKTKMISLGSKISVDAILDFVENGKVGK